MEAIKLFYDDIYIKKRLIIQKGNIDLYENHINLITGKNGYGKSLISLLIHANHKLDSTIVSQKNSEIFTSLSVIENITLTIEKPEKQRRAKDLIKRFGMDYILDRNIKKFSGGEKRVISLIRGLLSDASVIILDEPTNDLDYNKVNILNEIIEEYKARKTFIIITHDDRIKKSADFIYCIENMELKLISSHNAEELKVSESDTQIRLKCESYVDKITNFDDFIRWFIYMQFGVSIFKSRKGKHNIKKYLILIMLY